MSLRWPNSIVNKTLTTPSGTQSTPGLWKLNTVAEYVQQALWPQPLTYIEDVFSTYLYTGNGSTQTINNGIDLSGKGGMVWLKKRNSDTNSNHQLADTARGVQNTLFSNLALAQLSSSTYLTAFNSNGFSIGSNDNFNGSGYTYASWTFRKAPKFFDVVTYTGNGEPRLIQHNLGSVPGMIIVKPVSTAGDWLVYHRALSTPQNKVMLLNTTDPEDTTNTVWNSTAPTSTTFSVSDGSWNNNQNGVQYVAYLFAHDTTTDGLIQCGSYTGTGSAGNTVTLGWEPQYVLVKNASNTGAWQVIDNMRGFSNTSSSVLYPNTSDAEISGDLIRPTATGFTIQATGSNWNTSGSNYIYMAIRRGPMKTPTDATKVFKPIKWSGDYTQTLTPNFAPDFVMQNTDVSMLYPSGFYFGTRLLGGSTYLRPFTTAAEGSFDSWQFDKATGTFTQSLTNGTLNDSIDYFLKRAPGFFDVVCYTGNGVSGQSFNHNLGVVPELMIVKRRSGAGRDWNVYSKSLTLPNSLTLNTSNAAAGYGTFTSIPTSTVFYLDNDNGTNASGATYVNYLFATCPGVSKVGSYTGTGSTQTISCGFTGGARFVLIKRTDSTGDWWVWDTARGMVAGTDPRLALNSTAAETNANWVYTTTGGFQIVSTDASVNASGGSYIFLAIA